MIPIICMICVLLLSKISFQQVIQIGVIVATMFGQKCQKCMDDRFEEPMWYPEEVAKVSNFPIQYITYTI